MPPPPPPTLSAAWCCLTEAYCTVGGRPQGHTCHSGLESLVIAEEPNFGPVNDFHSVVPLGDGKLCAPILQSFPLRRLLLSDHA